MNRSDILKKCVDKGVAGETEVGAVSHLFYVYLLSALQRGQRVEVPKFGTFGTRVAGVKKTRKIPYFEPEKDLALKVNQRFENLKYLVVGKYVQTGVAADTEYKGKEAPYDPVVEQGKELIFDTNQDVPLDQFERAASASASETQPEEDHVMPRLNLRDAENEGGEPPEGPSEDKSVTPPPTLRDVGPEGGRQVPWLAVAMVLLVLVVGVFSLNYFHVIHLWGKKTPKVVEQIPEPAAPQEPAPSTDQGTTPSGTTGGQEATPIPSVTGGGTESGASATKAPATKGTKKTRVTPAAPTQASGTGKYTIQVSSWASKGKANSVAQKLTTAGFDAYVVDVDIKGEMWHRVRVGRYGTQAEARDVIPKLQEVTGNGIWIANAE